MVLKINPAFTGRQVSHHNVCKTVEKHTPAELRDLAIEARKSSNPILMECFVDLPTLEQLLAEKTSIEIAKAKEEQPSLVPQYNTDDLVVRSAIVANGEKEPEVTPTAGK